MKNIKKMACTLAIGGLFLSPILQVQALTKKETVYTNLDYTGKVLTSSVTNHLFNTDTNDFEEETQLKDILNINGNETYTLNEDRLTWHPNGKDIYYSGKTEKELPLEIKLTYYLNNEEIDAQDLIGKEGDIQIKISFENKNKETIKVKGSTLNLYTPYVVTMGMILNNEDNTNITINNGKVVDSGTKNMIVGICSPGMYENFKIKEFRSLDEIIISYHTKRFSQGEIYMVATPKMLEDVDLSIFSKLNQLSKNLNTLENSIQSILEGAQKLQNGSQSLVSGSSELEKNLNNALNALKKLDTGSHSVTDGLKQIIEELNKLSSSINGDHLTQSLKDLTLLKQKNSQSISKLVTATGMDLDTLMNYYKTNLISYTGNEKDILSLKSNCELILLLQANNQALDQTLSTFNSLNNQINNLTQSLLTNLKKLEQGSSEISNGLSVVTKGMAKLYNGSQTLTSGTKTLMGGIHSLATGITTFHQTGIQPLANYGKMINSFSNKAEGIVSLSKDYKGFASNNATNTTFVYKIKKMK